MTEPTVRLLGIQCMECKCTLGGVPEDSTVLEWLDKHRHAYPIGAGE